MTVLGKILVFVNLVFSLVTAGLIVMVFTTRTNWNDEVKKRDANLRIVRAQADADVQAAKDEVKAKDAQVQQITTRHQELTAQLKTAQADLDRGRSQLAAVEQTQTAGQTNLRALTEELARRKLEVETAQKQKSDLEKQISVIDQRLAAVRDDSVQFRIKWEQAQARNEVLRQQNEGLAREIGQLRTQGSAPAAATAGRTTVAPENFRGTIQMVSGDLAEITPGSDAGAIVGAKFSVFRMTGGGQYLGTIEITAVEPHRALGRLSGTLKAQIKKGDEVGMISGR